MNPNWKNFLLSRQATFESDTRVRFPSPSGPGGKTLCPIPHLAVLTIAGKDAALLLQGQLTCNVNDVTETQGSAGALCNPKGRAIATFLLVKSGDAFLMILPAALLETVKKRLQMYVLRSHATLTDSAGELCLIGLCDPAAEDGTLFATRQREGVISIALSSTQSRYLVIADADKAVALWRERVDHQGFQPESSEQWRYLDILSRFPWVTPETSEEFIPQMLGLDVLGGISFTKGCYTGQEIVARTHYLGKAKRTLFLAECDTPAAPAPNSTIIDDGADTEQVVGKVLQAARGRAESACKMLVVLQVADGNADNLKLKNLNQHKITLLP